MKNKQLLNTLFTLFFVSFILSSCNKNTPRYTSTTINPELIGKWQSMDGCYLDLAKENESLILISYNDGKGRSLQNLKLNFKTYSIETKLTNDAKSNKKFSAEYIDGAVIIESYCRSPLQKVTN